jgi:hypothetical protein
VVNLDPTKQEARVYVIIRITKLADIDLEPEEAIKVKKVVWSIETAEAEVARLNAINGPKGDLYFWQATRLEEKQPKV